MGSFADMDYWTENGIDKPKQVVVCAACRYGDIILAGARHFDNVMRSQMKTMEHNKWSRAEQGFINQFGEFLTREEALKIVLENGQKFDPQRNGSKTKLFSEGLY